MPYFRLPMRKRKRRSKILHIAATLLFTAFLYFFASHTVFHDENRKIPNRYSGQSAVANCEEIDVAFVCAGQGSTLRTVTLIKSLLYYRSNPLNLHFLVDESSGKVLSQLFKTWNLPDVKVALYSISSRISDVSWIPNRHYSGVYGLMKLMLTDVLHLQVEKILVFDTDVLVASDVSELWSYWARMSATQSLGLVENLSDWYLLRNGSQRMTWPALDRGFNTGVILMNLKKLRSLGWSKVWRNVAEKNLKTLGFTHLADQDIINAVASERPEIVYKLPCEWNFQMGFESQQELCPVPVSHLKVVHWNSPKKTQTQNRYAAFFSRSFKMFSNMDGNLLRSQTLPCISRQDSRGFRTVYEYDDDEDGCGEFRHARSFVYRTQLFIRPYSYKAEPNDIALITQFSMDRFVFFETLLSYWNGPIAAAVYISDLELAQLLQYVSDSELFTNRTNVAIHAVFKEGTHYPVNYLRNVALNNSDVPYVFLMDVDFLPVPGLYESMRKVLSSESNAEKTALVIPAFEFKQFTATNFPKTKSNLLAMFDVGHVQIFRQDVWIQGHSATDYDRWRVAATPYKVTWQTDYEPYVVLKRSETPSYDERFVGFGWNKVSHIMSLDAAGFRFVVLPDVFIVHRPHSPSFEIAKYRSSALYRKCLKALKGEFVRDLVLSKHKAKLR